MTGGEGLTSYRMEARGASWRREGAQLEAEPGTFGVSGAERAREVGSGLRSDHLPSEKAACLLSVSASRPCHSTVGCPCPCPYHLFSLSLSLISVSILSLPSHSLLPQVSFATGEKKQVREKSFYFPGLQAQLPALPSGQLRSHRLTGFGGWKFRVRFPIP